MNHKERMLSGLPYKPWLDGLSEERAETKKKLFEFNYQDPGNEDKKKEIMRSILGRVGNNFIIESPFFRDYGKNIQIGDYFFANYNRVILDVGRVIIGDNVSFAPNVAIYTAGHPIHHESRNSGYEYGIEIHIGNNVWLGGDVVVNPGIRIGDNSVVGSGSVVTKDIPSNVVAVGNPCRVIKEIRESDRKYYYKKNEFDVEDY